MKTTSKSFVDTPIDWAKLFLFAAIGGAIGLTLIAIFLFGVESDPAWPEYWKIRPHIVVTLAGAGGGALWYFMNPLRRMGGWMWIVANFVSIIGFIIALWLGTVLGLDGTLWN